MRLTAKTYNHPEGQAHPRAPKSEKRMDRDIDSFAYVSKHVRELVAKTAFWNQCSKRRNFDKSLKACVLETSSRRKLVDFSIKYLRDKLINLYVNYDVIIVGAGLHAATYLLSLKKIAPHAKVLILEKSSTPCSTFSNLGESLVLNSPTFSKVGLNSNFIPGSSLQLSDFDDLKEKPFPTARNLADLCCILLFLNDADVLFNCEVTGIKKKGASLLCLSGKQKFHSKKVVIANGMGEPKRSSFILDKYSQKVLLGDDFISYCFEDPIFFKFMSDKKVAVIGAGDTANCVMEYLLPLVYPNNYYGFFREKPFLPKKVYWFGQKARDVQEFFFNNKSRYCHSGGVIEYFWHGESPFELSTEVWKQTKDIITCVPEKVAEVTHLSRKVSVKYSDKAINFDLVIDCTGRENRFVANLNQEKMDFIKGSILLEGGHWCEKADQFIIRPKKIQNCNLGAKLFDREVYLLGPTNYLKDLIDDEEAKDGSLFYQEERQTLTNSKWSLEHTLPRTSSMAQIHAKDFL